MPRNGTGTYALPKPPFQPQTAISSADVNADLADIGSALTASLPRDGQAPMTGILPLAASGFNYSNDDDTGLFRSNANEQTIKCGGQNVLVIKTDGIYTGAGTEISSFVLGVPYPWIFSTPAPGTVFAAGQPCTPSYPKLRALLVADGAPYGNDGVDPLFPNLCGVTIAGRTTMGGSDRGNLAGGNVVGATIGVQTVALAESQLPPHTHTGSGTTSSNGDHSHTGGGTTSGIGDHTHNASGSTGGQSADHTHTGSGTTGGMNANNPHKHNVSGGVYGGVGTAKFNGGDNFTIVNGAALINIDDSNIEHGHSYAFTTTGASTDHTHAFSVTTTGSGAHSHSYSFSTSTNGAHLHAYSFTTSSVGGGAPHNNVQPTIILNYIMRAA